MGLYTQGNLGSLTEALEKVCHCIALKRSCQVYFGRSGTICVCVRMCASLFLLGCSMSIWQRPHLIINNRFVGEKRSRPLRHVVTLKTAVPSQFELRCLNWWLACSCCVGSLSGSHLRWDSSNGHRFCSTKHLSLLKQQQRCFSREMGKRLVVVRLKDFIDQNMEKLETWKMSVQQYLFQF